jgi:hypothetical protein
MLGMFSGHSIEAGAVLLANIAPGRTQTGNNPFIGGQCGGERVEIGGDKKETGHVLILP